MQTKRDPCVKTFAIYKALYLKCIYVRWLYDYILRWYVLIDVYFCAYTPKTEDYCEALNWGKLVLCISLNMKYVLWYAVSMKFYGIFGDIISTQITWNLDFVVYL